MVIGGRSLDSLSVVVICLLGFLIKQCFSIAADVVGWPEHHLCQGHLYPTPPSEETLHWTFPYTLCGVFLQSSNAWYLDALASRHFVNSLLIVLTAFLASPFDWGYRGDDVVCWNPHVLANNRNSTDENWGLIVGHDNRWYPIPGK